MDLIERLRSVKWDVISDGGRMPDDPTRECVFVDMRPDDFEALLNEAADALEAARRNAGVLVPPEGYALVSVGVLRAWGKLDEVRECCRYLKHAKCVEKSSPIVGVVCAWTL